VTQSKDPSRVFPVLGVEEKRSLPHRQAGLDPATSERAWVAAAGWKDFLLDSCGYAFFRAQLVAAAPIQNISSALEDPIDSMAYRPKKKVKSAKM
jgi:hypothetical protein